DVAGAEGDAGKFAEQVGFLAGEGGAAIDRDSVFPMLLLDLPQAADGEVERLVPGGRLEAFGRAEERVQEAVGVRALEVAAHAFRAEHPLIERELLPRLEAHHLIAAHLELNAALLTTETAVGFHQPVRRIRALLAVASRRLVAQVRAVAIEQIIVGTGQISHCSPRGHSPSGGAERSPAICVYRPDRDPASSARSRNRAGRASSSDRRCASARRTARRTGCTARLRPPPQPDGRASRRAGPGAGKCERTF